MYTHSSTDGDGACGDDDDGDDAGNNSKVDHDAGGGGDGGDGPNDEGNATHDDPHKRGHVAGDN